DLLTLEREGVRTDQEVINRIFRAIHSIKGASGFFGFEALKRLSHLMESVLMRIRDRVLDPGPAVISSLLLGVDKLNLMLCNMDACAQIDYLEIARQFETILTGEAPAESHPVPAPSDKEEAAVPQEIQAASNNRESGPANGPGNGENTGV